MQNSSPALEMMPVSRLKPYAGNARTHSRKQVRQIADSIERFGFTNPVLIGDDNEIIAGHGRVMAAKQLGIAAVPAVKLSSFTTCSPTSFTSARPGTRIASMRASMKPLSMTRHFPPQGDF